MKHGAAGGALPGRMGGGGAWGALPGGFVALAGLLSGAFVGVGGFATAAQEGGEEVTPPEEASPEPRPWTHAADGIDWACRIDVPNTEARMFELVMQQKLASYSREWIGEALEASPPAAWLDEARRTSKPVFWFVPAIEGQHVILPHLSERYFELGILADPDLTALLNRRFVPVKSPAAGELARSFDLVPPTFVEPGYLVLSPEGETLAHVGGVYTFRPGAHRDLLVEILEGLGDEAAESDALVHARETHAKAPTEATALELARQARLDGELADARAALREAGDSPEAALLRARMAREERDAARALDLLDELAEDALDDASLVAAERGRVLVESSAPNVVPEEALAVLRAGLESGGARADECGYWLGATLFLTKREDAAYEVWREVAEAWPDSPWGARADGSRTVGSDGLRGETPLTRGMAGLSWTGSVTREHGTRAPRNVSELDGVVDRALGFLLEQQRSDGAWYGSRWGGDGGPPPMEPISEGQGLFGNIHTAISALACAALEAWRERAPEEVAAALERGEAHLLRDDITTNGEDDTMWVYADSFRLLHFARRYPDAGRRPEHVSAAMERWVGQLANHQQLNDGHLRHYGYKSTFVTAMATLCLRAAEDVDIAIPEGMFAAAMDRLEATRDGDGLFGYLAEAPQVNRTIAGAVCRQPLCTFALLRCGRTDAADVVDGVSQYLDHYRSVVEPPRKANFHMPELDGSAGYFFFHNMIATSMALTHCGERTPGFAARLREFLCELPELDGAFVDSGISYGKNYGTASALLSLALIDEAASAGVEEDA